MVNLKKMLLLGGITITLLPTASFAWDFTGHVVIAQMAYNNLTLPEKQQAQQLAEIIFNQLPAAEQAKLNRQFSNASIFAKVAMLPDTWRTWKLKTIFTDFSASVPTQFDMDANDSTRTWHYINLPYPTSSNCHLIETQNVVWAIDQLEKSIPATRDQHAKAVEMVLLEHFIGDDFQPLHDITYVNKNCQGDEGGNDFCLRANAQGKCTKNLHSLWDSAVGYLKPHENIQQLAYLLQLEYPRSAYGKALDNDNAQLWAKTNYAYAHFIYSIKPYEKPDKYYYREGQAIAKSQMAEAGYELANELNKLL